MVTITGVNDAGAIDVATKNGKLAVGMGGFDSRGLIGIFNNGVRRIAMGVNDYGNAEISIYDKNENLMTKLP